MEVFLFASLLLLPYLRSIVSMLNPAYVFENKAVCYDFQPVISNNASV